MTTAILTERGLLTAAGATTARTATAARRSCLVRFCWRRDSCRSLTVVASADVTQQELGQPGLERHADGVGRPLDPPGHAIPCGTPQRRAPAPPRNCLLERRSGNRCNPAIFGITISAGPSPGQVRRRPCPVSVVDPGSMVDPVHGRPPNQPHSQDQPPYSARQTDERDKLP